MKIIITSRELNRLGIQPLIEPIEFNEKHYLRSSYIH